MRVLLTSHFLSSLVPQRFHRVQPRGPQCWNHPAEHADHQKHNARQHHRQHRNPQVNVGLPRIVLKQSSHQRQRAYSGRNRIRKCHADGAARHHDQQGLGQKLQLDVSFPRAQCTAQSDLANPLVHRHQHDIHHAHAADPQSQGPNKGQQDLQSDRQRINHRTKLIPPKHLEGFWIGRRKLLSGCHRRQNLRHGFLLELGCDWLKHHHCGVSRVPQITRRRVRNPRRLVIAAEVIAELDLARHHSDHSEAHPAHEHRFSHCWTPAEELFLKTATQKDHAPPLQFVLRINPTSFRRHFVPHLTVLRANSAHRRRSHHAVTIGNPGPPYGFQTRMLHQRSCLLHHLQVSLLKKNFLARALPTRLLAGLLRPADHHTFAKGIKPVHQNAAEAASVGDQQGDGGNPPNDPQHGQQTARKVPLQRDPSLENDLNQHSLKIYEPPKTRSFTQLRSQVFLVIVRALRGKHSYPPASYLNASIGSMEAAIRAGYTAAPTAIVPNKPVATSPEVQLGSRPAKKSGIGNRFTSAQKPNATPSPIAPLRAAIINASRKNCRKMVPDGAPIALRTPISRVRSRTATIITFITPMPPSSSVTIPTAPRKYFIPSVMVLKACASCTVSQMGQASLSAGS